MVIDETHDPARGSWVPGADGHADFPIQNLPLGIFSPPGATPRAGVAIGDHVLDLGLVEALLPAGIAGTLAGAAGRTTLNALLAHGRADRVALRRRLSALLSDTGHRAAVEPALVPAAGCTLHLPAAIGDYTDFYAGIHHATNVGRQFRPESPLLPNYKHVPIGYHGRASSIRASGVAVRRPHGQRRPTGEGQPAFGPSERLDYELELGIWIGPGSALGEPIPIARAADHIAGFCLLNDWSARDIQAWEYQPLGPFLAKSFHTSVSPWIVTAEALAPFRVPQPPRPPGDPAPLPYLWDPDDQRHGALAIELEALIATAAMRAAGQPPVRLSRGTAAAAMYWTVAQLVAHHGSNGCNLAPGDLLGTGTLSTAEPGGRGSLLELSEGGASPLRLPNGERRAFLADGDEIVLRARAVAEGRASIGFGACRAVILPAC